METSGYFKWVDSATTDSADNVTGTTWSGNSYTLIPLPLPEPVPVKLVLPHKKHLVPVQQEAKRREQLKAWGLRR
jgi:hypothetical protein